MTLTTEQAKILEHLKAAYVGPENGTDEELTNRPSLQYSVGILFPREVTPSLAVDAQVSDVEHTLLTSADVAADDLEEGETATTLAEDWRPSSAAITFVLEGNSFSFDFKTATYSPQKEGRMTIWRRTPYEFLGIHLNSASKKQVTLNAGGVEVEVGSRWRPHRDKWLVTLYVRSLAKHSLDDEQENAQTLFQVELSAVPDAGSRICEHDVLRRYETDDESAELRVRYRNQKVYAVGHGMAADWESDQHGGCSRVYLDPVPHFVVPAIAQAGSQDLDADARPALNLEFLASIETNSQPVLNALGKFVSSFSDWADAQTTQSKSLGPDAERIASRSRTTSIRMLRGIEILRADTPRSENVRRAFSLAMSAMNLQMKQAAIARGEKDPKPAWRPFQLGFLLVSLASTVDDKHQDREIVDLIWFPTGGGKTEAYLALAAVVMYMRRLEHGTAGGGTAVITRYTLRLLTSQQFQRAAALICAMELLRGVDPRTKKMAHFSIGLWVGNDVTPGTNEQAKHALDRLYKAQHPQESNQFQITECPWCFSEIMPTKRESSKDQYGVRLAGNEIRFRCVNSSCEFVDRDLPMNVVDEILYNDPPTFLLATVDKFARLQFKEQSGRLLGLDSPFMQPSLIIQDEMHLLSGPLGTTVAVFDAVIQMLLAKSGSVPKIVASTATIRSSEDQVRGLYGREVSLYPPAGLDGDETYFAKPVRSGEGRLYVGIMPQSVSQASALVSVATPMLEVPQVSQEIVNNAEALDNYWTLVMYHNSLRELGRSSALLLDDINGRLSARAGRIGVDLRQVQADRVIELTSRKSPEDLPKDLRRLRERVYETNQAADAVLSSNMLSVGIDVQRLALMLMVGQPKTTAEYIQATSRVGRGDVKGVIVTLFRSNRARDRSHFETFRSYHEALYRSVEPTSVTPWSLSSRERSMPGALIALLRHWYPQLAANDEAGKLDLSDPAFNGSIERVTEQFVEHIRRSDGQAADDCLIQIQVLLREWDQKAAEAREALEPLKYERAKHEDRALVKRFGHPGDFWIVGDSMRSVDPNVAVEVQESTRN